MHIHFTRRLILVTAGTVVAAAIATTAVAAIPGGDGQIRACVAKAARTSPTGVLGPTVTLDRAGTLRAIDADKGQACTSDEQPLAWDVKGTKGDTGLAGPQGAPGAPGAAGASETTTRTFLKQPLGGIDASPAGTPRPLLDLGTFTKAQADTVVKITWNGHVTVTGECGFYIAVDGQLPANKTGGAIAGTSPTYGLPAGATALFTGLAAGSHSVALFDATYTGPDSTCASNLGGFDTPAVVEEQP